MSEQLLGNERVVRKLVSEGDPLVTGYTGSRGEKNNGLLFKRNFADGTLISFNIVSHKKRSISMVTLYMNNADYQKKKDAETLLMQNAHSNTSKTQVGQPSNNSITDSTEKVNSETKFSYKVPAESKVYKQIAEWERKP